MIAGGDGHLYVSLAMAAALGWAVVPGTVILTLFAIGTRLDWAGGVQAALGASVANLPLALLAGAGQIRLSEADPGVTEAYPLVAGILFAAAGYRALIAKGPRGEGPQWLATRPFFVQGFGRALAQWERWVIWFAVGLLVAASHPDARWPALAAVLALMAAGHLGWTLAFRRTGMRGFFLARRGLLWRGGGAALIIAGLVAVLTVTRGLQA
jgi:threonine/homoserine/homoserine lactone efflux protein